MKILIYIVAKANPICVGLDEAGVDEVNIFIDGDDRYLELTTDSSTLVIFRDKVTHIEFIKEKDEAP